MSPLHADIPEVAFNMMPDSQSMAIYKDRLIVYDNINTPLTETYTDEVKHFVGSLPVKIDFTICVFCLEGRLEIDCNLLHYSIAPGEMAVFVPGTIGDNINIAPDSKMVVLTMSDNSYVPSGTLKKKLFSKANFARPIKFAIDSSMIWPAIQEYQHLKHAMLHAGEASDELIGSYMMVLASFAAMSLEKAAVDNAAIEAGNVPSNKLFNDFMDLLGKNFIEHKDVAFYAEACGLSPKYFSKQILKASGKTVLDWIKAHVVLNAQAMLKRGDCSVAEVSEALKFSSQSAFNRYFKNETGMSPKEYQKQL